MDIKRVIFNIGRQVSLDGKAYVMTGCIIRQGEQGFRYQVELKDANAESSLVIADLQKVEEQT